MAGQRSTCATCVSLIDPRRVFGKARQAFHQGRRVFSKGRVPFTNSGQVLRKGQKAHAKGPQALRKGQQFVSKGANAFAKGPGPFHKGHHLFRKGRRPLLKPVSTGFDLLDGRTYLRKLFGSSGFVGGRRMRGWVLPTQLRRRGLIGVLEPSGGACARPVSMLAGAAANAWSVCAGRHGPTTASHFA